MFSKQEQWRHIFVTEMVTLITDASRVDDCAKVHEFPAILASLFVF